jgi:O-antigen/teichoic acid export membrane protein
MGGVGGPDAPSDYLRAEVAGPGLGRRAARGTAVTLLGQWSGFVLQTLSTIVLARLLTPRDYGIVAGVLVLTGLAELLKDLGLGAATVQRRNLSGAQLNALFWVNTGLGLFTAGVVAASAPLVAAFYDQPESRLVTVVLAVPFVFSGLSVQHQALLSRTLQFAALARNDVASRAVGLTAAIVAAAAGAGYWALVVGPLVTAVVRFALLWLACRWRPSRPAWAEDMRSLLGFGGWTSMFSFVNYFSRNADNALIGRYWGADDLGIYSRAYQLLLLPIQQINGPVSRVALPTLSRLQDDPERYRRFYSTALTAITFVSLPAMALMAVLAEEIVTTLLGDHWVRAAAIFQVLAIAGITHPVGHANGWLYQTTGNVRRQALWGLGSRSLTVAAFLAGLPWGPYGVAVGYAVANFVLLVPGFALATRGTPVSMTDIVRAIWRPAAIGAATYAVAWTTHTIISDRSALPVTIAATLAVAAATYALAIVCWPSARGQWGQLSGILRSARQREPVA